jgi:hypothetical protein
LGRSKLFAESDKKNEMEVIAYCLEIIGRNTELIHLIAGGNYFIMGINFKLCA